jgi:alpha-tubulin suppressor-like RCC1 family protein
LITLKDDGGVFLWGRNTHGQCGVGATSQQVHAPTRLKARAVEGGEGAVECVLNEGTTFVILS